MLVAQCLFRRCRAAEISASLSLVRVQVAEREKVVMPTHRVVSIDEMSQYLHLPEKAVAKELGDAGKAMLMAAGPHCVMAAA